MSSVPTSYYFIQLNITFKQTTSRILIEELNQTVPDNFAIEFESNNLYYIGTTDEVNKESESRIQ